MERGVVNRALGREAAGGQKIKTPAIVGSQVEKKRNTLELAVQVRWEFGKFFFVETVSFHG